jgi:hypothetical protein
MKKNLCFINSINILTVRNCISVPCRDGEVQMYLSESDDLDPT